jgi:hypothetical protein
MNTNDVKYLCFYIFYTAIIFYLASEIYDGNDIITIFKKSFPHLMIVAATLASSAWITLGIIQRSLKDDKMERMETLRINTYTEIRTNIILVMNYVKLSIPFGLTEQQDKKINSLAIAANDGTYISEALSGFVELLEDAKSRIIEESKNNMENYVKTIKLEYQNIGFYLNNFRNALFPRVLDFSENRDLVNALTNFEKKSFDYENLIRSLPNDNSNVPIEEIVNSLIVLLSAAENVCFAISEDLED